MKRILILILSTFFMASCEDELNLSNKNTSKNTIDANFVNGNEVHQLSPMSALSESGDFTDYSGRVKIKLFYGSFGFGAHLSGAVSVGSDYVLVGGAAWVENTEAGALLTESRPDNGLTTWYASSKDHSYSDSHTLHIIAIGMKLEGLNAMGPVTITPATLRSYMQVFNSTSSVTPYPNTFSTLQGNYNLIGGGSKVNYSGTVGNLLTSSYPSGSSWYAKSKDHIVACPASITAYSIGIQNVAIPNFGFLDITRSSATAYSASGIGAVTSGCPTGYVISCPGASATYNGGGRILFGIKMDEENAFNTTAFSKDHRYSDSGYTTSYNLSVRLKP